jgi:hypothetical protein
VTAARSVQRECADLLQDPAQYLIPNLALRERKNYHDPSVYGSITGGSLQASGSGSGAMKDGGMSFGKTKVEVGAKGKGQAAEEDRTSEKIKEQQPAAEIKPLKKGGKQVQEVTEVKEVSWLTGYTVAMTSKY